MDRAALLETTLAQAFVPSHLLVQDESHRHNTKPGAQSHFRVLVVAAQFAGVPRLERHRRVHQALAGELAQRRIHALAIEALTPEEWQAKGTPATSPPCAGGERAS